MSETKVPGTHPALGVLEGVRADTVRKAIGEPTRVRTGEKLIEWWDDERREKSVATTVWEYDHLVENGRVQVGFLPSMVVGVVFVNPTG